MRVIVVGFNVKGRQEAWLVGVVGEGGIVVVVAVVGGVAVGGLLWLVLMLL